MTLVQARILKAIREDHAAQTVEIAAATDVPYPVARFLLEGLEAAGLVTAEHNHFVTLWRRVEKLAA